MSDNSIEKRLSGPFQRTDADWQFVADMRKAAKAGVGYGFMQQVTEWEWQDNHDHSWGPEYFGEERKKLTDEIGVLQNDKETLLAVKGQLYASIEKRQQTINAARAEIELKTKALNLIAETGHLAADLEHKPNVPCPICVARTALREKTKDS